MVAASIARDAVRLFALTREQTAGVTPIARWRFQDGYPEYPPWVNVCAPGHYVPLNCMFAQHAVAQTVAPVSDLLVRPDGPIVIGVQRKLLGAFDAHTLRPSYGGPAQVNRPLASFLRSRPGPLRVFVALRIARDGHPRTRGGARGGHPAEPARRRPPGAWQTGARGAAARGAAARGAAPPGVMAG